MDEDGSQLLDFQEALAGFPFLRGTVLAVLVVVVAVWHFLSVFRFSFKLLFKKKKYGLKIWGVTDITPRLVFGLILFIVCA